VRAQAVAVALVDGVGVRVSGTEGDRAARAQVAELLRQAGWDVAEDPFDLPQGGTTANVIATLGAPPAPDDPHVVVGGHIDTRPDTPGANDNASGIGVLVALAEELADEAADLPLPVVLIAFGAEEYQPGTREHHLGSERYAGTHPGVVAMLAVDISPTSSALVTSPSRSCGASTPTTGTACSPASPPPADGCRAPPRPPYDRRGQARWPTPATGSPSKGHRPRPAGHRSPSIAGELAPTPSSRRGTSRAARRSRS
jgi:aminopeptidase YwaD